MTNSTRLILIFGALAAAAQAPADEIQYLHTDLLGNVVLITDQDRNVIERRAYEPYGLPQTPIPDGPGFTGHDMDGETGLVYMQQRYYDPQVGRFLSVDSMAVDTATAWNFNRYNYAANNPYRYTDPDGRHPLLVAVAIRCAVNAACRTTTVAFAAAAVQVASKAINDTRQILAAVQNNDNANTDEGSATDSRIADAKARLRPAAGAAGDKGQMEGDLDTADAIIDSLGSSNERTARRGEGGSATVRDLPDGSVIVDYPSGGGDEYPAGTRTIEIQRPAGKADEKWRFPDKDEIK